MKALHLIQVTTFFRRDTLDCAAVEVSEPKQADRGVQHLRIQDFHTSTMLTGDHASH